MAPFRHTKLVCTIGPASEDDAVLSRMLDAGMDVARLNLSHGSIEEHERRFMALRRLSRERLRPLAIMVDIQGPKIRLGDFPGSIDLRAGEKVWLQGVHPGEAASPPAIPVVYPGLASAVRPDGVIFLDDGNVRLQVEAAEQGRVRCLVVTGGAVSSRKGVALSGVDVDLPALTPEDEAHLRWAAGIGVDLVAASFVRRAAHVEAVRQVLAGAGSSAAVIAKIESAEGVRRVDEVARAADGVMVARGDLGVDIPLEDVPLAQKRIVHRCNALGKPVITATQMLESMVRNASPTRAEVADVANAIFDGTDAVMLSGETAVGAHPAGAVSMLHRIAVAVEREYEYGRPISPVSEGAPSVAEAISHATCQAADELGVAAILCSTQSGATARMVARFRPRAPIVAATPFPEVARALSGVWGVFPIVVPRAGNIDDMIDVALAAARRTGTVRAGDRVAVTAGVKTGVPGSTNLLQVLEVAGEGEGAP